MIEEYARVIEAQGNIAWVETQRKGSCGTCSASAGCGTATLSKVMGRRQARVQALNTVGAGVGEEVVIGIPESALLKGSFAVYAVPLLAMLVAAWIGTAVAGTTQEFRELLSTLFGLGGLAGGFVWLKGYAGRIGQDTSYRPVILRRVGFSTVTWVPEGQRQEIASPGLDAKRESGSVRG